MDVTAAILAGGLGTRLLPALSECPKVLAPVLGRPYLVFLLDFLARAGMERVVLLTGFRGDQVRTTLGCRHGPLRLEFSQEAKPLGTGGALRLALDRFGSGPILLLNGDSFCAADLLALSRFHQCRGAGASLVLARAPDPERFGQVRCGPSGRVESFLEKQAGPGDGWINAGIYLLEPFLVREIEPGRPVSLERDLLPDWVARGLAFGFPSPEPFLDIGTPESYASAAAFFAVWPGPGGGTSPPGPARYLRGPAGTAASAGQPPAGFLPGRGQDPETPSGRTPPGAR